MKTTIFYIQENESFVGVITETQRQQLLFWLLSKPWQHMLAYFSGTSKALLAYCSVLLTGMVELLPAR